MNLAERLSTALRFVFNGKAAYEILRTWENGQAVYPLVNFEATAKQLYRVNELIYACVALKADSAAQPRLAVFRGDDELPDHPLRQRIERPNPYMTEFDFHALTLTFLDLAGRAYWEKVRSRAGGVAQLWPLRPDWMRPIRDAKQFIRGYEYKVPGTTQAYYLKPDDVLDFKLNDPLDFYNGLAPAWVAGRVGGVDNETTDFIKMFFQEGGMPQGILTTKQKLTETAVASIRAGWLARYGGGRNWTKGPAVLDSDATYQAIGSSFKDMGFEGLDARAEARICMVLRVPPIMVGAKVGLDRSTFANYAEARRAFWDDTLAPQYKRIRDEMQNDLASEYEDGLELHWDFSEVPALQEDRTNAWTRAVAGLQAGGITVNTFLREIGEEEIGEPGDVFLRSSAQVEVPVNGPRPQLVSVTYLDEIIAENGGAGENNPDDPAENGGAGEMALLWHGDHKATQPPDDVERRRRERQLSKALNGYFEAQLGRVARAARKDAYGGANGRH